MFQRNYRCDCESAGCVNCENFEVLDLPSTEITISLLFEFCFSAFCRMDWPRDWPDVIDILVNNIKSNDDELKRYRSLLILSHVVKTLSTKRLAGDRRLFYELTANLYPIMFEFWNYVTNAFLSAVS